MEGEGAYSPVLISIRDALINAHNLGSDGERGIRGAINARTAAVTPGREEPELQPKPKAAPGRHKGRCTKPVWVLSQFLTWGCGSAAGTGAQREGPEDG